MRRFGAALLLVALGVAPAWASAVGEWVTDGDKARVNIAPCAADAQKLCGTITWSYRPADAPPGELLDIHNTDAALRSRPIVGLPLLQNFSPAGTDAWDGGTIYDPESGKTYKCTMKLTDAKTLDVRGYIGVPAFGRSTTWTRVEDSAEKAAAPSGTNSDAPATATAEKKEEKKN